MIWCCCEPLSPSTSASRNVVRRGKEVRCITSHRLWGPKQEVSCLQGCSRGFPVLAHAEYRSERVGTQERRKGWSDRGGSGNHAVSGSVPVLHGARLKWFHLLGQFVHRSDLLQPGQVVISSKFVFSSSLLHLHDFQRTGGKDDNHAPMLVPFYSQNDELPGRRKLSVSILSCS